MPPSPRFRVSIARLMVETCLLSIPLGMVGGSLRGLSVSAVEITFILALAIVFVFEMEVFIWYFLRPKILEPIGRWLARGREGAQEGER